MVRPFPSEGRDIELPPKLRVLLAEFLLDKNTGTVVLNIKNGEIRSVSVQKSVQISE